METELKSLNDGKEPPQENETAEEDDGRPPTVSSFELLMELVGAEGRYQWILLIFFMFPFALFYHFGATNVILLMSTPPHVCHVPGISDTNYTLEEWHNLTIPWETGSDGKVRHSQCKMYNVSAGDNVEGFANSSVVYCQYGWDYDNSSWVETPVTKFNWVCDDAYLVATFLTVGIAAGSIGALILSVASDRFGRKPATYVGIVLNLAFGLATIFSQSSAQFGIFRILAALPFYVLGQLPFVIVYELCDQRFRSITTFATYTAFILSNFYVSSMAYLLKHWKWFLLSTHLPIAIMIFYWRVVPESPRWLLYQGRLDQCEKIMSKIASVNRKPYTDDMKDLMKKAHEEEMEKVSALKICSSFVFIKHMILGCAVLTLGMLTAVTLNLNVHNMPGNIFVNYIFLRTFELPGNFVGIFFCNFIGRRLSSVVCMLFAAALIIIASFLVTNTWALIVMCGFTKVFLRAEIYSIILHTGELFPTPLRSTAYGMQGVVGMMFTIPAPMLAAIGRVNARMPYYIVCGLSLLGALVASFLPETLGFPLPQTMQEGLNVGKGQPYLSIIHKWNAKERYLEISKSQFDEEHIKDKK